MWIFWVFWIEVLALSYYALVKLWPFGRELNAYQWSGLVVYSVAAVYGTYAFGLFLRRRLKSS